MEDSEFNVDRTPRRMEPQVPAGHQRIHQAPMVKDQAAGQCEHCGATLSGQMFFCLVCGLAYREAPGSRAMPAPKGTSELIREEAPNFWPVFWSYAIGLFVTMILTFLMFAGGEGSIEAVFVIGSVVMLLVTAGVSVKHASYLKHTVRQFGFQHTEAWMGLLALVPLLGINWLWHSLILFDWGGMDRDIELGTFGTSPFALVMLLCVLPAFSEEIGFRGLLQPMLSSALGRPRAIWLVALLFAGIHLSVYSFPYLLLVGLLLGWVRDRTASLYPGMVIHALHNWFVVAFFWS
jgi:membrane protease YdiL (CAAX protease family)